MDVIDLNCDMGESFGAWVMGSDTEMLKIVTSANVACGFHGGDPLVMFETVSRAKDNRVGIGAHPSFFDVWGFGRRMIQGETPEDIEKIVVYQIGALQGVARAVGHRVGHVKAHGTLANLAAVERPTALAIGHAIAAVDRELIYVVMAGTELERAAGELGLRMAREIYADRAYTTPAIWSRASFPVRCCTIPRKPPRGCRRWCVRVRSSAPPANGSGSRSTRSACTARTRRQWRWPGSSARSLSRPGSRCGRWPRRSAKPSRIPVARAVVPTRRRPQG